METLLNNAIEKLQQAKAEMEKMISCTADWTAGTMLETEFEALTQTCMEFGKCQFGIGISQKR